MLCCGWAMLRGGPTERSGGEILGATWLASWAVTVMVKAHDGYVIAIDVFVLLAFITLSLKSRKLWITFAAACQFNDLATHMADKLIGLDRYSYVTMLGIWGGYAQIVCLFCGMVTYRRSLTRLTPVP